jgi:hypothetical protein
VSEVYQGYLNLKAYKAHRCGKSAGGLFRVVARFSLVADIERIADLAAIRSKIDHVSRACCQEILRQKSTQL